MLLISQTLDLRGYACPLSRTKCNSRQLEIMVWELARYPVRSLHKIYPWDHDCLVRAVLSQAGTAPLHLPIIEGDDYFVTTFHKQPHLLPLQQQHKEMIEIEIALQCLHLMNFKKVYPQLQMPLSMETVHLAEAQMEIPFWIQVSETGADTPICTLRYADETIGQAYEAVGWAFPAATEYCKSFTIHDQGWEIFRHDLFPPVTIYPNSFSFLDFSFLFAWLLILPMSSARWLHLSS